MSSERINALGIPLFKIIIIIIFIGAANFEAVLEWTNWVTVIQAVQICWFNGNGIGADKYASQLGN